MSTEAHTDFGWRGLMGAWTSTVAAAMADYERLPSTRRRRQREERERESRAVEDLAASARAAIEAWRREQDLQALRARLDAMAAERGP